MIFFSVSINGIHLLKEYKLALKERHCVQPPVPKMLYQDVPGADGSMDLSTASANRTVYERREIKMNFGCGKNLSEWPTVFSSILREFHGKNGTIIFDDDPSYFYTGRMAVSDYKRVQTLGTFTITINAEPYKYELLSSLEDWKWGPFNFRTGVIRDYKDLQVSGSRELVIFGTEKWVIPEITASGIMAVRFEGNTYDLKKGVQKIYGIVIKEGNNQLVFNGNGTISVSYRGGVL